MVEVLNIKLESENLVDRRIEQMRELFPEVFSEGGIDFDKLRLELGDKVDDGDERYSFTWPGKRDAIRQSQTSSIATLRPSVEKSRGREGEDGGFNSDNIYIEGDNLEVLKLLQRGYHGKVRLIYIDPPYNTGHDFVYRDSFGDSVENYKKQADLVGQSNAETSGRYHSCWCSMMYPRLRLARELLMDEGALFVSIDDNELSNLRSICDELFGETNFVADIIWKHTQQSKNDEPHFSRQYNHTLCYAKNKTELPRFQFDRTEQDNINYSNPDNDPKGRWRSGDVRSPNPRPTLCFDIIAPDGTRIQPPENGWRWSEESIREKISTGEIKFKSDNSGIIRKIYLSDQQGRTPENIWEGNEFGTTRSAAAEIKELFDGIQVFETPKPKELICKMLELFQLEDGIVLDFFAGSSSTWHAISDFNSRRNTRFRSISVQIPERCREDSSASRAGFSTICEIGEERMRRAGDKIKAELEESNLQLKLDEEPKQLPDIGFRVFKLDESGIKKPEEGQLLVDCVKPDRSDLDIVFEMMLKWGLELTLPIEREELAGYSCYTVAYGELVCCLAPGLTIDALEAIAEIEPRRVLILDSILDDSLKLNAVQIFKRVEERTGREVELRTV